MKYALILILAITAGCYHSSTEDTLALIQIQDRNGLTETISNPDRLTVYESVDFFTSQPYKKVLRVYKTEGKNQSKITTYHPNGVVWQYLEAEEMRAHGSYREWFQNGQIKIEATVIGGTADVNPGSHEDWLFDHLSQVWDEHGNLIAKIPYEKGMLEGTSVYYYPSGQIEREIPFVRNSMQGDVIEYTRNGIIKSKTQYKNGIKEGSSLGYFSDGALAWDEDYSGGLIRTGAYYSKNGELVSEITNAGGFQALYDDNDALTLIEFRVGQPEGLVKKFTPYGELHRSYFIRNGKKQGEETEFYLSSEVDQSVKRSQPLPKLVVTWNESTIHGPVKTWYNNGQLQSQREYSNNKKSGSSLAWYRDGSFMLLEEYEEEKLLNGQYFKAGKPEPVSTIINGNGLATIYDETGAFLRKVSYVRGKPFDPES
ncbi:MAG: hypothetical protein COT85_08145 [Chlamydiae bacterium CG10_big_fil_rev_8_21_14_0_10_42_34]|nr:MAG: hypothetical protein COT85_08145 [Chlamydiae bacterium CG10_big_fil_rev_8_21_14_0_10_42_34]